MKPHNFNAWTRLRIFEAGTLNLRKTKINKLFPLLFVLLCQGCDSQRIEIVEGGYALNVNEFKDYKAIVDTIDSLVCENKKVWLNTSKERLPLSNYCKDMILDMSFLTLGEDRFNGQDLKREIENYLLNPEKLSHLSARPEDAVFFIRLDDETKPGQLKKYIMQATETFNEICLANNLDNDFRFLLVRKIEPPPPPPQ